MKPIKMFGLAALAALMAMAFVGASSAMAETTILCSGDGSGCGVTHVHETTLSGAKAKLLTSIVNVECDVLFLGDTATATEEGVPVVIEGRFTYSNCGSCTVTEEGGPVSIEVLRLGHETADVTGEGEVHVNCTGLNCFYNGEELLGTGKGPLLSGETNGSVTISEQTAKKVKGLFCPATSKLDITTTPLSATYLGSSRADYCVKYEHTHGHYLNVNNRTCIERDANRLGNYELVTGPAGVAAGTMVCVRMSEAKGLYLSVGNGTACASDTTNNNGLYELAEVQ